MCQLIKFFFFFNKSQLHFCGLHPFSTKSSSLVVNTYEVVMLCMYEALYSISGICTLLNLSHCTPLIKGESI